MHKDLGLFVKKWSQINSNLLREQTFILNLLIAR